MDFPDEIDTPLDKPSRDKLNKYKAVKRLKTCEWDAFENLPPEYSKIWMLENS